MLNKKNIISENIPVPLLQPLSAADPMSIDIKNLHFLLSEEGAVILRNFDFTPEILEKFSNLFCHQFHTPATRSSRKVSGDNYSTEVFPHNYTLLGHTEGSYRPNPTPPEICFFMCITPPIEKGGETTLADGIKFLELLPQEVRSKFEKFGITYEMYWEKERWMNEFYVNDKQSLEKFLSGVESVKYNINQHEELHLFYTTSAITKSRSGKKVFATAILAHLPHITHPEYINKTTYSKPSNRVYFGDGEELSDQVVNQLIDIYDQIIYPHRWQERDVVVVDNTRYLHGRTMTEKDCPRSLISRFGRVNLTEFE
ncbi:MAG TPA: hypothetical protein DIV86_06130 [Alphaproteobacteria bacterium]|nr:hypothetical protein [Alphaproteobacteria bacterium]